jgi:hypothetical protein
VVRAAGNETWVIKDEAIDSEDADRFDHAFVARQLAADVTTLTPPATIALLAPFGTGKSSVGKLLAEELKSTKTHSVVRFSAEKHTGIARQRAMVHSFGESLVEAGLAPESDVGRVVATLRDAQSMEGLDPTSSVAVDLLKRDKRGEALKALGWTVAAFAVAYAIGVVVGIVGRIAGWTDENPLLFPAVTAWQASLVAISTLGVAGVVLAYLSSGRRSRRSQPRASEPGPRPVPKQPTTSSTCSRSS